MVDLFVLELSVVLFYSCSLCVLLVGFCICWFLLGCLSCLFDCWLFDLDGCLFVCLCVIVTLFVLVGLIVGVVTVVLFEVCRVWMGLFGFTWRFDCCE